PSTLRLRRGDGEPDRGEGDEFIASRYAAVAERLGEPGRPPFAFEAREHTAQVDSEVREWRENRFRFGSADKDRIVTAAQQMRERAESNYFLTLPICSPTMMPVVQHTYHNSFTFP